MDQFNEAELREKLAAGVRLFIKEALDQGLLPADTAKLLENYPAAKIDSVVDSLMEVAQALRDQLSTELDDEALIDLAQQLVLGANRNNLKPYVVAVRPEGAVDKDLDGAMLFVGRGNKMLKTERYPEAKAFFKRALEIKENLRPAWLGLADAHQNLDELREAEEARRRAD